MKRKLYGDSSEEQKEFLKDVFNCSMDIRYIGLTKISSFGSDYVHCFNITITNITTKEMYNFNFYTGILFIDRKNHELSIYDVMGDLVRNFVSESYEEFCIEFGYDSLDSKSAYLYEMLKEENKQLIRVNPKFYEINTPELEDY